MKKLFSVRIIILAGSLLLQLSPLCFHSHGAPGDVDLSFDPGSGVNGTVNAIAVQPDGKAIIGGQFTTVKGLARSRIARLNADGSGDATFNPGTGVNYGVSALALQSDGKVLIGGYFTTVNGTNCNGIARLNANGSLDSSFNPVIAPPYAGIFSLVLQSDGKVLIGGGFTTVNGTNRNGIARLNADGSLDSSFNPGTFGGYYYSGVSSIAVQPNGKVLIGGEFITINGTNRNRIARLNANGSLDTSFDPGTGADWVISIVLQPDGKVLFGGYGITRLNSNGSPDTNFNANANGGWNNVASIVVQPDGKVLIGGDFITFYGANSDGIARLNANGSVDSSFNPGTVVGGYPNGVNSVAVQSDGKVLLGGYFSGQIARLSTNGSVDSSFDPGTGLGSSISSLVVQPGGKVLIGGVYTFINGTNRYGSARLNADGSLDGLFISNTNFHPDLTAFIGDRDCGSQLCSCQKSAFATAVAVQTDGNVLIGGQVATYVNCEEGGGEVDRLVLARFNVNGSSDNSFDPAIGDASSYETVNALAVQPDGKIVVGGYFSSIKGTNRNGIARLNANGSLDTSFNPGTGASGVSSIKLQADGKMIIGGYFSTFNGTNRNRIARLNANGSLDTSFNPGTGANGDVSCVAIQSDGKVLIGGSFTSVNGTNRNRIARLNANGSLDSSFNPGTGPDGIVRSIALQPDGNVLIGGDFLTVNGVARPRVARLYGDSVAPSLNITRSNAFMIVSWPATGLNFQLEETTNLSLPNSWMLVGQAAVTNEGTISVAVPPTSERRFFRLKSP